MSIYLSHNSAYRFWISAGAKELELLHRPVRRTLADAAFTRHDVRAAGLGGRRGFGDAIHLLHAGARGKEVGGVHRHCWHHAIPSRAFVQISADVYVSTPEFCLLQLAGRLGIPQLVIAGTRLMSAFRIEGADLVERPALCNRDSVRELLGELPSAYGCRKLAKALRWMSENAASPIEEDGAILLALPRSHGGYGLGPFSVNHRIPTHGTDQLLLDRPDRSFFSIDFYWHQSRMGLEYFGHWHRDERQARRDQLRLNSLKSLGYRMLVCEYADLSKADECEVLVSQIRSILGREDTRPSEGELLRRRELRAMLFGTQAFRV